MTRMWALVVALSATVAGGAEVDVAVRAVAGKEAAFTQRFTPKGFKTAQIESGSVIFGALPQMRWNYTKPEAKTFVFDGSQSWFYVPADRQVTVGKIDEARKRELPFLLLGDAAARDRAFVVKEQKKGNSILTTLSPRDRNAMIRDIVITTNASDHLITRVDYSDREGNRTSFDLGSYRPRNAGADTFRFTAPAGTQVVNAP